MCQIAGIRQASDVFSITVRSELKFHGWDDADGARRPSRDGGKPAGLACCGVRETSNH